MQNIYYRILNDSKREPNYKSLKFLHYKEQFKYLKTRHSFHLVDPSP